MKSFPNSEYKNVSDFFRKKAHEYLSKRGEDQEDAFDYEAQEDNLSRLMIKEDKLEKILKSNMLVNRRSAYDELCYLVFGRDKNCSVDDGKVIDFLHSYEYHGDEVFSEKDLEYFIQYYELLIKRRKLQNKIKLHRRRRLQVELPDSTL